MTKRPLPIATETVERWASDLSKAIHDLSTGNTFAGAIDLANICANMEAYVKRAYSEVGSEE